MSLLSKRELDGGVVTVSWEDGENRCNLDSMREWHELLDELERRDGALALVVTGTGKFFSNGLDLDRFTEVPEEAGPIVEAVHRLFGRLLLFPAWTVAAVNGHAFAAGAMLSCAFDRRIMRNDRGYWCLPEVDLGLPLTDAMTAVVTARLPAPAAADAMISGRRYTADEAQRIGIVDATAPEDALLGSAIADAASMANKDRTVIADHKRQLFGAAGAVCGVEAE